MGCCPFLKANYRVSDEAVSCTLAHQDTTDQAILPKTEQEQPLPTIASESPANPTPSRDMPSHHLMQPPENHQLQSNLDIVMSASASNECESGSSLAYDPGIEPTVVLIAHSCLRESIIYRWESSEFQPNELFLPIDYDRLFKPEVEVVLELPEEEEQRQEAGEKEQLKENPIEV